MSLRPSVLIMQRHLAPLSPLLEHAFDVYRFWEGPPLEAQAAVRALVVAGEFPLDLDLVERLPNLSLIACFTSGYDGIDVDWCRARGLEVTHAPGVNHEDVADHALGLIISSRRQIVAGDRQVRSGAWKPDSKLITPSLGGQKVGIVGLGAIGEALARRCEALGLVVSWWGPRAKPSDWPYVPELKTLARQSDILVVACRADEANRGLICADVIDELGPGGLLVNVARGQLVDETALIDALRDGRLGQAALDVYEDEPTTSALWADVPNTVLTPHTAGATSEAVQRMVMLLLQNLDAAFAGRPVVTPAR